MYFTFCKVLAEALPALQLVVPDDSSLTPAKQACVREIKQAVRGRNEQMMRTIIQALHQL